MTLQYHLLALLGGALGIIGAFVQELRSGGGIPLALVGAPIIEEVAKPASIYIIFIRWPHILKTQPYVALLTAISGLSSATAGLEEGPGQGRQPGLSHQPQGAAAAEGLWLSVAIMHRHVPGHYCGGSVGMKL